MDEHQCYYFEASYLADLSTELDSKSKEGWKVITVQYSGTQDGFMHRYFIVLSKQKQFRGRRSE